MKRTLNYWKPIKRKGKQQFIFGFILFLFPFVVFAIVELTLRLVKYGESYPLFHEIAYEQKTYKITNPEFGRKYFSNITYTSPVNDLFLAKKPENGLRFFVFGSSTVV